MIQLTAVQVREMLSGSTNPLYADLYPVFGRYLAHGAAELTFAMYLGRQLGQSYQEQITRTIDGFLHRDPDAAALVLRYFEKNPSAHALGFNMFRDDRLKRIPSVRQPDRLSYTSFDTSESPST